MDFFCSCFFQHVDQIGNGSSADNGIIHQNDSLPLHHGFQNAQLQMDTGLSLLLCRLDKSSSNVTVFIERKAKRDSGFLRIAFCCRKSGFRYTGHQVRFYRIGFCKRFSSTDPCIIDFHAIHGTVQSCKINIFKNTMGMLFLLSQFTGFQSVFGDRDNLTWFNITDKFSPYRCQRTAFRCKDIGIISFSKTEGFQSVRITGTDQLPGAHDHKSISSADLLYGFMYCFLYSGRMHTFSCDMERDNL